MNFKLNEKDVRAGLKIILEEQQARMVRNPMPIAPVEVAVREHALQWLRRRLDLKKAFVGKEGRTL